MYVSVNAVRDGRLTLMEGGGVMQVAIKPHSQLRAPGNSDFALHHLTVVLMECSVRAQVSIADQS